MCMLARLYIHSGTAVKIFIIILTVFVFWNICDITEDTDGLVGQTSVEFWYKQKVLWELITCWHMIKKKGTTNERFAQ